MAIDSLLVIRGQAATGWSLSCPGFKPQPPRIAGVGKVRSDEACRLATDRQLSSDRPARAQRRPIDWVPDPMKFHSIWSASRRRVFLPIRLLRQRGNGSAYFRSSAKEEQEFIESSI